MGYLLDGRGVEVTRLTLCIKYFSVVVVVVLVLVLLLLEGDVRGIVTSGSPKVSSTVPKVVSGAMSSSEAAELLNIVDFRVVLVKKEARKRELTFKCNKAKDFQSHKKIQFVKFLT